MRLYQPKFSIAVMILAFGGAGLTTLTLASDYDITINTASLNGTDASLAFDLVSGGSFGNSATISDFVTNGIPTVNGPNSGAVFGALPGTVTLSDSSFFNEYLEGITLGSTVSFQLDVTSHAPTGGALPDTFSLFVLDSSAASSLLTTTDPSGADALVSIQINGSASGILGVYTATPGVMATVTPAQPSTGVPEPDVLTLMILGVSAAAIFRRMGRRRRL